MKISLCTANTNFRNLGRSKDSAAKSLGPPINFSGGTKNITKSLNKEAKKELKGLMKQAKHLFIEVDSNDTIESLRSKIIKAQKIMDESYDSYWPESKVTDPISKMVDRHINGFFGRYH